MEDAGSLAEALAQLKEPGAVAKAGGVDLLDRMKEGVTRPRRLVDLSRLAGLGDIVDDGAKGLRIGPLATLAGLEGHAAILARYPALAQAAAHVATPQIRNMATLGGNLVQRPRCWYFRSSDFNCRKKGGEVCFAQAGENQLHALIGNHTCAAIHPSTPATALLAYGARLELTSASGAREVPIEEFFTTPEVDVTRENQLRPGELLTQVLLPAPAAGARAAYLRQGEKEASDWPIADVAVVLELSGRTCGRATVALGAIAPVPWRARGAEAQLAGKTIDEATATQAARAALEGATPMTKNRYKLQVFAAVIRRAILAAAGGVA
jgi:xanthine dehydrogenase YagS FAD-binding subunit